MPCVVEGENLKCVLEYPWSFVILVFSWLAHSILVLGEHFVLKDLPFYKVAWLANTKAM